MRLTHLVFLLLLSINTIIPGAINAEPVSRVLHELPPEDYDKFISKDESTASLHVSFGDYENYLYRDDKTAAQVLFTSANASSSIKTRFIAAFPGSVFSKI
jgi:hypothetical protein